ncbi:hypothetical protein [Leisingera aquimarina]|uniref:hypothetical protein n=1 Tax=Leisingera aquimarina TaxID=476529 RepID=UPI0003F8DD48|nr:hypothetical protein [Leisingera aquimarina]
MALTGADSAEILHLQHDFVTIFLQRSGQMMRLLRHFGAIPRILSELRQICV